MLNGESLFSKEVAKCSTSERTPTQAWESYIKSYITAVLAVKEAQEQGYYAAENRFEEYLCISIVRVGEQ